MAKGFNLADALANVSELDTGADGREQIEYIDIDRLEEDANNFYSMDGLDELAANIQMIGLQQPIRVREDPGKAGYYIIVSGHRRSAAIRKLVADGEERYRAVACIRDRAQGSAALQELRLIYANSDTRRMSSADISKQAERVEALLYQLKGEGYDFPGRMRDHVAEACKVSRTKLARLKVIRDKLDPVWKPSYESGDLAESTAYTLAQMPAEHQVCILRGLQRKNTQIRWFHDYEAKSYGKNLAAIDALICKKEHGAPCSNMAKKHAQAVYQSHYYSSSSCARCCAKCDNLAKCANACPKLADKIKTLRADAKAQRQQERLAKEERERHTIQGIEAIWKRFGCARAQAGKSVKAVYQAWDRYYARDTDQEVAALEGGMVKIKKDTELPYGYGLRLCDIDRLRMTADLFDCSLDYLLCRTDVREPATQAAAPQPEGQLVISGWMPGGTTPSAPGEVVAVFDLAPGHLYKTVCRWDGAQFVFAKTGERIDMPPLRWMALPPDVDGTEGNHEDA